ncbi:hypothetical protein P308_21180 [Pseudomonas piscis]|nr:hypothetical protein P308_21180 [Pseudomonas piscis]
MAQKPMPNSSINPSTAPWSSWKYLPSTTAAVAVPQAYQPIWVKPRIRSLSLLPRSPKQKRPIKAELSPLLKAM